MASRCACIKAPFSWPQCLQSGTVMVQLQDADSAATDLIHEGKELVEEVGDERLDARQVILVEGIHKIPQGSHSIYTHLHTNTEII